MTPIAAKTTPRRAQRTNNAIRYAIALLFLFSLGCAREDTPRETKSTNFDKDGEIARNDDLENELETIFFDLKRKHVTKYDKHGNVIEIANFDLDGKPCPDENGYVRWTKKYDEHRQKIEFSLFGEDGKPCLDKMGYATETKKYDEQGNVIEWAYFGTDGKPCLTKDGYAKRIDKKNEGGSVGEISYFGTDGKPCQNNDGNVRTIYTYDEHWNLSETIDFDIHGNLTLKKYDKHLVEISYFDARAKPRLNKECFARKTFKYDVCGK